jgi:hypothetical protein
MSFWARSSGAFDVFIEKDFLTRYGSRAASEP